MKWQHTISALCVLYTLLCAPTLYAQQTPISAPEPKLPMGTLVENEYAFVRGTTLYKKYKRVQVFTSGTDSIMMLESFNIHRNWTVNKYLIKYPDMALFGWQSTYDIHGTLLTESYCDTLTGRCDVRKQYHYYPNGQYLAILQYDKRWLEGQSNFYYNSGTLKYTLEYHNNRIWNILAYYDQQGQALFPGDFSNGSGTMYVYAANGILLKKKIYRNGRLIKNCTCKGNADCPCEKK